MVIYAQKLSNPLEEWSLDTEPSDTIVAVISKILIAELPAQYSAAYVKIFFNGTELNLSSTLSDYNIQKFSHLTSSYDTSPARAPKHHTLRGRTVQGKPIFSFYGDGLTPQTAGSSAYQIKTNYPSSTDGLYWIKNNNINSGDPFKIYADMTTDGGGWTLILTNTTYVGWTTVNAIHYNDSSPSLDSNYSIVDWADYIKKSSSGFQYMIDANERNRWGAIWTANGNYSFVATNNSQTNITLNTKFDNWEYADDGVEGRMPWYSADYHPTLTTNVHGYSDDNWWGTLVTVAGGWTTAPWMNNAGMGSPARIWYWVR